MDVVSSSDLLLYRTLLVACPPHFLFSLASQLWYTSAPMVSPIPIRSPAHCRAHGGSAMTFEEILDQAMSMLQRRGRVAYRTLQVQFNLDDNALEALKDELLYAQQVARDEDGRVLVWTGGAATPPSPPPRSTTHASQPTTQEASLPRTAPRPVTPSTPEAERRQLTVLFCDLVDSTALASLLDSTARRLLCLPIIRHSTPERSCPAARGLSGAV
jgi:hypothetical protein